MNIWLLLILVLAIKGDVVEINDANFPSLVSSNPEQLWMIMFGAQWVHI